jgi:hypothetical protein
VGKAEVTVTGKFAQFGGRMMNSVSDMILGQFAQNFSNRAQMQAMQQSAKPVAGESSAQSGGSSAAPNGPAAEAATDIDAANHAQGKAAPVQELNAIGLLWGLIKRFFAGLFR